VQSIAMSMSVCMSASARLHVSTATGRYVRKFSLHDDSALCYVLPKIL